MREVADGYYTIRAMDDKILCVMALLGGRARITIGRDMLTYDNGW